MFWEYVYLPVFIETACFLVLIKAYIVIKENNRISALDYKKKNLFVRSRFSLFWFAKKDISQAWRIK